MTASDEAVARLIERDPRIRDRGFMGSLKAAVEPTAFVDEPDAGEGEELDGEPVEQFREMWREHRQDRGSFNPDAFWIDPETKTAYAYEVEDTNPLRFDKLHVIGELANLLFEFYWDLEVIVLDTDLHERYRFNGMLAYLFPWPENTPPRKNARDWVKMCVEIAAGRTPDVLLVDIVNTKNALEADRSSTPPATDGPEATASPGLEPMHPEAP